MSSHVLFQRDTNIQPTLNTKKENEKPKTMEYHRQVLEERLRDGKSAPNYVSPSDTIMSPATQKLAAFKNKHMAKRYVAMSRLHFWGGTSTDVDCSSKPRSLFAQTATKNAAASGEGMFADIPRGQPETTTS